MNRSLRNGRPPGYGDVEELQTVDLVDRADDHGRPSERQYDGSSGDKSTVDRHMEDGRPSLRQKIDDPAQLQKVDRATDFGRSSTSQQAVETLGHSQWERRPNVRLADYVTHVIKSHIGERCRYPLSSYVTYEKFSYKHKCFFTALDEEVEPTSFEKAFQDERWSEGGSAITATLSGRQGFSGGASQVQGFGGGRGQQLSYSSGGSGKSQGSGGCRGQTADGRGVRLVRGRDRGKGNLTRIYDVCKAFYRADQQDQSLQAFFMDFKKTYEALNSLMPFTLDVKTQQQRQEQMAIMSFLAGLATRFEAARERVFADSEVPSL
ncbi:unnamed protein product [Cuscuta campestris]|uniref:Uncharacterized protein n=1 Tax=Cuscuta campestris TaxID=132261 RepID=A0A484KNS7_9ASTE|nr:unnamed protein product [Cuscuta campestris]